MGVLHVVSRVLVVLAPRQVEVEIQVRSGRAHEEEELRAIGAHVLHQVAQRDELASPLAHLHRLPARQEIHLLDDQDLQEVGLEAQRLQRGFHARHVAVMIGTPQVDRVPEAPRALVAMVGDVGQEVGRRAAALLHHAILVVAEAGGAQEGRLRERLARLFP